MNSADPGIVKLKNEIYRFKVLRARRMSFSEKFALGAHLFDENMAIMRASIRSDHPEFTDDQVEVEVSRRLTIARKLDDGDLYRAAGGLDE